MKTSTLEHLDTAAHVLLDWYINATILGRHLPGWGILQVWQHRLCDAYENRIWSEAGEPTCCNAHHFEGCTDGEPGCCPACPINPWRGGGNYGSVR